MKHTVCEHFAGEINKKKKTVCTFPYYVGKTFSQHLAPLRMY